jgi:hypothetical protein
MKKLFLHIALFFIGLFFSNEQLANTIMIKAILKSKIGFEELSKCPSKHAILSEGP